MSATRWERINALFDEACEHSPDARESFLADACADDPELLRELRELLDADGPLDGRITRALFQATQELVVGSDQTGRMVGPYRLVRELGHGGMGAVYLAERTDGQFEQRVALKLIRLGMASAQVEARFRLERQILARLQHPGIARLLDGGVTTDGQPFFAMEYVEGQPVDDYCREAELTISQRLSLFDAVCTAVAYAHANLVVHRDLKPDNILVTSEGTVRLLDFGIAKVMADDEDATIGLTTVGSRAMTPAYASPEQVRGEQVGTAADVYALGVILYELLAGARPYNVKALSPAEMQRAICDIEPPPPSSRGPERELMGDLDVICLKALRKDPDRRYRTVEALLEDIRRHQQGRPVLARPDTLRYRLRTRWRRHRSTTLGIATLLAVTIGLSTFYTLQIRRERDGAQLEARKASETAAFLRGLFANAESGDVRADTVSARTLLDRGAARVDSALASEPVLQAEMMRVIADAYMALGVPEQARPLLERAVAIQRRTPSGATDALAATLSELGATHTALQQYPEAENALGEAYQLLLTADGVHGELVQKVRQRAARLYAVWTPPTAPRVPVPDSLPQPE